MTIDEAKGLIGAWVKTQHRNGGGNSQHGAKLVGVSGSKVLLKFPGVDGEPVERNPGDVHIWKSRTAQEGKVNIEAGMKATKVAPPQPAPVPPVVVKPRTAVELLAEFENAKAELEQWSELEKSCKDDLEQAKIGYDLVNQRVIDLRKELKQRIDF